MQGDIYLDGKVTSCALGFTSNGKDQLAVTFRIESPPEGIQSSLTAYLFFSDASLPITEKALRDGLDWDPVTHAWDVQRMTEDLVGREASLVCCYETYNDKKRLKVKFINAPGGSGLKERMEPAQVADFQARLRARVGMSGGGLPAASSAPAARASASGPPAHTDDDIPF